MRPRKKISTQSNSRQSTREAYNIVHSEAHVHMIVVYIPGGLYESVRSPISDSAQDMISQMFRIDWSKQKGVGCAFIPASNIDLSEFCRITAPVLAE